MVFFSTSSPPCPAPAVKTILQRGIQCVILYPRENELSELSTTGIVSGITQILYFL